MVATTTSRWSPAKRALPRTPNLMRRHPTPFAAGLNDPRIPHPNTTASCSHCHLASHSRPFPQGNSSRRHRPARCADSSPTRHPARLWATPRPARLLCNERRRLRQPPCLHQHEAAPPRPRNRVVQQSSLLRVVVRNCVWPNNRYMVKFPVLGLLNRHSTKVGLLAHPIVPSRRQFPPHSLPDLLTRDSVNTQHPSALAHPVPHALYRWHIALTFHTFERLANRTPCRYRKLPPQSIQLRLPPAFPAQRKRTVSSLPKCVATYRFNHSFRKTAARRCKHDNTSATSPGDEIRQPSRGMIWVARRYLYLEPPPLPFQVSPIPNSACCIEQLYVLCATTRVQPNGLTYRPQPFADWHWPQGRVETLKLIERNQHVTRVRSLPNHFGPLRAQVLGLINHHEGIRRDDPGSHDGPRQ